MQSADYRPAQRVNHAPLPAQRPLAAAEGFRPGVARAGSRVIGIDQASENQAARPGTDPFPSHFLHKLAIAFLSIAIRVGSTLAATSDTAGEFSAETWQTEDGLPQTSITALLQGQNGLIWIGTYNGLVAFDGVRFTVFTSGNTPTFPESRVTSLFQDLEGTIWIGGEAGSLTRLRNLQFEPVTVGPPWPALELDGIGRDEQGDLWLANRRGLLLRLRDGHVLQPLPGVGAEPGGPPEVNQDYRGRLIVTRNGVVAGVTNGQWEPFSFPSSGDGRPYYSRACAARQGGIWVAGEGRVRRWDGAKWAQDLGEFPWGESFITTMLETRSRQLLVGTIDRGLFVFHEDGSNVVRICRTNGLPHDWVRALVEDRERNIWVGTSGGLTILRPRKVLMHSPPDDWLGCNVLGITQSRDGAIWAGTEGAGIYRYDGRAWQRFAAAEGLENQFVWTVLEDAAGRLWAGTWGGGLFVKQGAKFVVAPGLADLKESVTALHEFPEGRLWIGTGAGLARLENGRLESLARLGGPAAASARAITHSADGTLWFGTSGAGLGALRGESLHTYTHRDGLPGNYVLSLCTETNGTLWIGTLDNGVCRLKEGRFTTFNTAQGLPNNIIAHIGDDLAGHLWFSSEHGIFRASKAELNRVADGGSPPIECLVYGKPEGLTTLACSGGFTRSGFRAQDGNFWFPTSNGLAEVNPDEVRRNLILPHVLIEETLVDAQPAATTLNGVTAERELMLPPGRSQLEIHFTALSFTSPEQIRFRHRLVRLENDWIDGGNRRSITYSYLRPGRYLFQVMACNNDGRWNESAAQLAVIVLPFFWQTAWFRITAGAAAVLGVAAVVYLAVRSRERRKVERLARESVLERERARIAQDIHDDLGASLTRIGMLSQTASADLHDPVRVERDLKNIYSTARELTRAMDEIVWAVNPRHDTLDSLVNYLTRFAQDFLSPANIRCRLFVPLQLPDWPVRSEVRHNVFLAYKESLNNAVKHAAASEVRISLEMTPRGFTLTVADNGRGFATESAPAGLPASDRLAAGNGLANMRRRLDQIEGVCEIESTPGSGTKVMFLVAIPRPQRRSEAARDPAGAKS